VPVMLNSALRLRSTSARRQLFLCALLLL
jgi:hypothetical protein